MSLSYWQRRAWEPDLVCRVAVVGGGLVGASTAYWLRRMDASADVALIDRDRVAAGASGRNAGFLLQGASSDYLTDIDRYGIERTRRLWHFTRENRDLLFAELSGRAFDLEASGSLTAAATPEEDERLRACVAPMRADGAPVAYLPADETNRRLGAEGFHGGLYLPYGAMLNPAALVRHVVEESGARLLEHHEVIGLEGVSGRVCIETPRRRVWAERVVLATNAYLPRLYPALSRYVRPVRGQMLATEAVMARIPGLPVYSHDGFFYIRQAPSGALIAGGARHLHLEAEVGYADETTPAVQRDIERYVRSHFPRLRDVPVRERWSGIMGFSPDHLPVVGPVPGMPGSYWAGGFSGQGLGYGFRFGRLLAELALDRVYTEGLDLFSVDRFDDADRPPDADGRSSTQARSESG